MTSTRKNILLSFQKWYKRRENEINEAKELVVREGKRLTLSKLGKLITLRLLSITINVIVFSREQILQNIKFSLTYLYKTKQFYPCEPAPIYFPAIYGTDLDCVTTQVERFGGKYEQQSYFFPLQTTIYTTIKHFRKK